MVKCLEIYSFPRVNHKETENLNRPITSSEITQVIKKKNSPNKQKSRTRQLHRSILANIF